MQELHGTGENRASTLERCTQGFTRSGNQGKAVTPQGFPDSSVVKNLPAMQETWVQSLGREDPLEEERTIHFSFLTQKIPWTEEPGELQPVGLPRVRHNCATEHACPRSLGQMYLQDLEGLLARQGSAVAHCRGKNTGGRGL